MKKHVLVIADIDSNDRLSLEKARDIIQPLNATVDVIKFLNQTTNLEPPEASAVEQAQLSLDDTLRDVFDENTEVFSEVIIASDITERVVEHCLRRKIDLVVKSRHRTESLFHTPTDWKLIRQLSCPILIASHARWRPFANILLALDFSTSDVAHQQLNSLIIDWGKFWSNAKHFKLHALYSIPIAKALMEFDAVEPGIILREKSPEAQAKMDALLAECHLQNVSTHIAAGPPDNVIPHWAAHLHSDLVIMGSIGRDGAKGFLLGNTAEKTLHKLYTDCLVVNLQ